MAILVNFSRKLSQCSTFFIIFCITIVLFTNIFMSLTIYEQGFKPSNIVKCPERKENVQNSDYGLGDGSLKTTEGGKMQKITTQNVDDDLLVLKKRRNKVTKSVEGKLLPSLPGKSKIKGTSMAENKKDVCPKNDIIKKHQSKISSNEKISCQPHKPTQEACKFADELYPFNKTLLDCANGFSMEYCSIDSDNKFSCTFPNMCERLNVYAVDRETGLIGVKGSFENQRELKSGIQKIIDRATMDGFKFVFIKCIGADLPHQLLSWVPSSKLAGQKRRKREKINVNVVLLDSISRAHFYRSLPLVIKEFDHQNRNENSRAEILDFSLFQSVDGHTTQNSHALFSGELLPESISDQEKEVAPVGIDVLFGMFKKAGYETLYHDDLCWSYVWGLRKELGVPRSWKQFHALINVSNIDDTGLSVASCEILKHNGLRNPFSESKDNQLCYSNKFQHDYILEYSAMFHENTIAPTISYTALNTAHDWHGLRTQTLNKGMASHVRRMSESENTITVLMADHGNTYTPYVRKILEGRYEMYHPSLFMVIPDGVAKILGAGVMETLRANQNRLLTMIDIHYALKSIAHLSLYGTMPADNRGALGLISKKRTCHDVEIRLPNLCVCEGWDSEAANGTNQVSVLEFGVGILNNKIQDQRRLYFDKSRNKSELMGPQKCNHLVPIYFRNVRERNHGDNLITVFDFIVEAGKGIDQKEEIFHVEIQSVIKPGVLRNYIKLLSFDRLSRYGPYSKCADKGVDVRLCVCSLDDEVGNEQRFSIPTLWKFMPRLPKIQSKSMLYSRVHEKCIYLIARYYYVEENNKLDKTRLQASTLEVVNLCSNATFSIQVNIKPIRMKISTSNEVNVLVERNSLRFICILATENISWPTSYTFTYTVMEVS